MKLILKAALAFATLAASIAPAHATNFVFSYVTAPNETVTGVFSGTLGSDSNTISIASLLSVSLNGVQITTPLGIASTDAAFGLGSSAPSAKLDASYLDFFIGNGATSSSSQYIGFAVGDRASSYYGNLEGATSLFGGSGGYQAFSPSSFTIAQQAAAVPEATSWAMMLTGFGMIGFAIRRSRRAIALG